MSGCSPSHRTTRWGGARSRWSDAIVPAILGVFLLAAAPAAAQDSEATRTALFHEGTALADKGRLVEAEEKLKRVIAIRSAPRAVIALGLVEERLKHLKEAKGLYERAIAEARIAGLASDERTAAKALELLLPRISHVLLKLPLDATVRRLAIDGEAVQIKNGDFVVGSCAMHRVCDFELDPGEHTITAEADADSFQKTFQLAEGDRGRLLVSFSRSARAGPPDDFGLESANGAVPAAPIASTPPRAPETEPEDSPLRWVLSLGVGAGWWQTMPLDFEPTADTRTTTRVNLRKYYTVQFLPSVGATYALDANWVAQLRVAIGFHLLVQDDHDTREAPLQIR